MAKITRIDHIAIAVEDIETALLFWRDALGLPLSHVEDVPSQKAEVAFLPVRGSEVELVRPTEEGTGVARFLLKRGPGMHHICLEVDDIEGCLARLKELDIKLINETPVTGSGGRRIAFIHPEGAQGVLVELNEAARTAPKLGRPDIIASFGRIAAEGRVLAAAARAFLRALRGESKASPDFPPVVLEERGEDG
jgi:methylmalonyl-CoA/ethylmalonyl-CoA epimerase